MELKVLRFQNTRLSCKSLLFLDGSFFCFVLEDPVREKKIAKVTAIPKGKYQIKFREAPSPLTTKYREKYSWFNFHLHLQRVPGYQFCYIHVGNNPGDTDGCLLVNNIAYADGDHMGQSADTFRRLYVKIKSALEKGEKVYISISEASGLKPLAVEEAV